MQTRYYIALLTLIAAGVFAWFARSEPPAARDATEDPVVRKRSAKPAATQVNAPTTPVNRAPNNLPKDDELLDAQTASEQTEVVNNGRAAADRPSSIGPTAWMGEVDAEEERRIDELLDQAFDRRTATQEHHAAYAASSRAATGIVDRCYEELLGRDPSATGRLAVSWGVKVTADHSELVNVQIDINHGLVEPTFEQCVLSGLEGAQLPSVRKSPPIGGSIATYGVERAFIFDRP